MVTSTEGFTFEGHYCHDPGALDSPSSLSLMAGTIAGYSPRDHLTPLVDETSQQPLFFIVQEVNFILTEVAELPSSHSLHVFVLNNDYQVKSLPSHRSIDGSINYHQGSYSSSSSS
jgi:hypothetical protein